MYELDDERYIGPEDWKQAGLGALNATSKVVGAGATGLGHLFGDKLKIETLGKLKEKGKELNDNYQDNNNKSNGYNNATEAGLIAIPIAMTSLLENPALRIGTGSLINYGLAENNGGSYDKTDLGIDIAGYGAGATLGVFAPALKEFLKRKGVSISEDILEKGAEKFYRAVGNAGMKTALQKALKDDEEINHANP